MNLRLLVILLTLLTPVNLLGQQGVPKEPRAIAAEELESIISDTEKITDRNAIVYIKARTAALVSFADPARAENMFRAVWKYSNNQTDEAFDKEQANLLILKYLFPRNPRLARQLLAEQSRPGESSPDAGPMSNDKELRSASKLASLLADTDPSSAAGLLEQSLSMAVTPGGVAALNRLRETNSLLSDYVATKVIEQLPTQPTLSSLPSLFTLGAYAFPGAEAPMSSAEAESSLQLLQYKYFLASYEALRASLKETNEGLLKDQHYTPRDLQYRASYQAQLASVLAALAFRFQPSAAIELGGIASKLASQVPAELTQLSRFTLARISGNRTISDDPDSNFFLAISNGDFDEAGKLLDGIKDDEKKDAYTQLLIKSQAKALLAKSDIMGALTLIRKLQDQTARIVMYLDAMKVVKRKQDPNLTTIVIDEARLLIPQTKRNGIHVRALLSFASQLANPGTKDGAVEFLSTAVGAINGMAKESDDAKEPNSLTEEAMAGLNDPKSLFDAPEMEQAFTEVSKFNLDAGLVHAKNIQPKAIQLLARLQAIQTIVKQAGVKTKPAIPARGLSSR